MDGSCTELFNAVASSAGRYPAEEGMTPRKHCRKFRANHAGRETNPSELLETRQLYNYQAIISDKPGFHHY